MIISTLLKTNNVKKGSLVNVSPFTAGDEKRGAAPAPAQALTSCLEREKKKILTIKNKSVPLGKVLEEQSKAQHSYLSA